MRPLSTVALAALLLMTAAAAIGADWPTFRYDAARSGVGPEKLDAELGLRWAFEPTHPPRPAWPEPGRELNRMDFDYVSHVAIADGLVFFGSSSDHQLRALDLSTGEERWSFFAGGPIRFAPCVADGQVYVPSDDGVLYCVDAESGDIAWTLRGGPRDERFFGNEQMISRWPLRSGVVVDDGVVYFAAGMWPSEGVYLYALNADDGSVLWRNDSSDQLYLPQPHPPSVGITGVSPQGDLVVTDDYVFVPTGRNVPAAFSRADGQFLYYHSRPPTWGDRWGGAWNFATGDLLVAWRSHQGPELNVRRGEAEPWPGDGLVAFDAATGTAKRELPGKLRGVVRDDVLFASGSGKVTAYDWPAVLRGDAPADCVKWEASHGRAYSLILSGDAVVVGGVDSVSAFDADTGRPLWQGETDGQVRGLAAADGCVVASTTTGEIACFGAGADGEARTVSPATRAPRTGDASGTLDTVRSTGIEQGYALLLGADAGIAEALAASTGLHIVCADPDPASVTAARKALAACGLYGPRVVVHEADWARLPYADYFANLVIVTPEALADEDVGAELFRVLHPAGGALCVASGATGSRTGMATVRGRLRQAGIPDAQLTTSDGGALVRGPLPGAGAWSHQYANAARTGASDDAMIRAPLRMLWFGEPGPVEMVSRHWKGPAPLGADGRMFVLGESAIIAVDAYNGRELWRREIPKAGRFPVNQRGGNAALVGESLFVATGKTCIRLDAATGDEIRTYEVPEPPEGTTEEQTKAMDWDHLAVAEGILVGSMGAAAGAAKVFGLDVETGEVVWAYDAVEAVHHDAIAIEEGRVLVLDRPTAAEMEQLKRRGSGDPPFVRLSALDLDTGEVLWETSGGLRDRTDLRVAGGVALVTGGGRMTALSAETGRALAWSGAPMRGYPVIVGDVIYGEPFAYDLRTGQPHTRIHPLTSEEVPWSFARSYGCGTLGGCPSLLFFRSGIVGYYDIADDSGVGNVGGVRAGCYVNAVAANGLLFIPVGDAGCTCSYSFQTTVALMPSDGPEEWTIFAAEAAPAGTPIRRLALNLGAPGDSRDGDGALWLTYPRPGGLSLPVSGDPPTLYRVESSEVTVAGTEMPWLYTSGAAGPLSLAVGLGTEDAATLTVRLHFADVENVGPGERVFDVLIQGDPAIAGLDVAREAGGGRKALVKEITGVEAAGELAVELVPRKGEPILSAIEIIRE